MFETPYHFNTIRNTTAAFGRLFANIKLERKNGQRIRVPLAYGPKRAWYLRVTADNASNAYVGHSVAIVLPRMSFQMTGLNYDPIRKTSSVNTYKAQDGDLDRLVRQFNPMPYDYNYELSIMTKNTDDGLRIVEQILPQFKPQIAITVRDMPELELTRDIPVIFTDIANEDTADLAFTERQVLIWTLNFIVKGYLYPPITDDKVIKLVNAYINRNPDMTDRIETIRAAVNPSTANEWDVDSNGEPLFTIDESIIQDSNGGL